MVKNKEQLNRFIEYLSECFTRSGTILVKLEECLDQAMEIVNNNNKNNNTRDKKTQLRHALSVALETAIVKSVPGAFLSHSTKEMDFKNPHTFAYDNIVMFENRHYTIDATVTDSKGYLSDSIRPAGNKRSDGYEWTKFKTKQKHQSIIDVLVGGHITIADDFSYILCDFDLIVDTKSAFDLNNWHKSMHSNKSYLCKSVCRIV